MNQVLSIQTQMADDNDTSQESDIGNALPRTATLVWTIGSIGILSLLSGLTLYFFKKK